MKTTYTVLVYREEYEEDGYWATVAELPGCLTSGYTLEEIRENIKDAIETYFEGTEAAGGELPAPVVEKFEIPVVVPDALAAHPKAS